MIDIENKIYSDLTDLLSSKFKKINYSSTYSNIPSSYPFVSCEEIDNYTNERTEDSSSEEYSAKVAYEINIYTQGAENKKTQAKKISNVIDEYMRNLSFIRKSKLPIQTQNETFYRLVLRYEGVVTKNTEIYRR